MEDAMATGGLWVFDTRATTMEFLDRADCDPGLAAASYRFMETVNCRCGGIRIVRRFLSAETAGRYSEAPLRVLDIGSGNCDWLGLENSAQAELTSEDVSHPIESALTPMWDRAGGRQNPVSKQSGCYLTSRCGSSIFIECFTKLSSSAHMSSCCGGLPTAVDRAGKERIRD